MKTITKLSIHFAPTGGQNTWTPSISFGNVDTGNGARASARFTEDLSGASKNTGILNSMARTGVNAAPRFRQDRHRSAPRRFFTPTHTFEHRFQ